MTSRLGLAGAFVDRDGVITAPVLDPRLGTFESPLGRLETALVPGAVEGLRGLRSLGFCIVVVSNQPAAAKGAVSIAALGEVHERTVSLLAEHGAAVDAWRYCFHHPQGVVADLRRECDCRKPRPGLITRAAVDLGIDLDASWMIGDADSDVLAGEAAGCRTILVEHPRTGHRRGGGRVGASRVPDLPAAVRALTPGRVGR